MPLRRRIALLLAVPVGLLVLALLLTVVLLNTTDWNRARPWLNE